MNRSCWILYVIVLFLLLLPHDSYHQVIHDLDVIKTVDIVGGTIVVDNETLTPANPGDNNSDVVITIRDPYPYYAHSASLHKMCGATLIYRDVLVTAAHCIDAFIESGIYLDTTILRTGGQWYPVLREIQHPLYPNNDIEQYYDIMLVLLDISNQIISDDDDNNNNNNDNQYVTLNFDPNIPEDGEELTVMGFGDTVTGGSFSLNLLQVNVETVNAEVCKDSYGIIPTTDNMYYVNTSAMVCNGSLNYTLGGQDSCQGDSGGPLLITGTNLQIGLVSFGKGCALPNTPSVNTRISAYQRWITLGICILSSHPPINDTNYQSCSHLTNDDYEYFWGSKYDNQTDLDDGTSICQICQNHSMKYPNETIPIPTDWLISSSILQSTKTSSSSSYRNVSCLQLYWNSITGLYSKQTCWNIRNKTEYQKICGCTPNRNATTNENLNNNIWMGDDDNTNTLYNDDWNNHNTPGNHNITSSNHTTTTSNQNTICYICNGNPSLRVDTVSYTNTITYQDRQYTCYELEQLGLHQYIDNVVCINLILYISYLAQAQDQVSCSCQLWNNPNQSTTTTTSLPCVNSDSDQYSTTSSISLCQNNNMSSISNPISPINQDHNNNHSNQDNDDLTNPDNRNNDSSGSSISRMLTSVTNMIWYQPWIVIILFTMMSQ